MNVGYARVSSTNQNIDLQINALNKYGVDKIFMEKQSAVKYRPELDSLLEYVRAGDTVVVWKLDRIARSLRHLINIVETLKSKEVNFVSITESIDTTTSLGKFFLQINGKVSLCCQYGVSSRFHRPYKWRQDRGKVSWRPWLF